MYYVPVFQALLYKLISLSGFIASCRVKLPRYQICIMVECVSGTLQMLFSSQSPTYANPVKAQLALLAPTAIWLAVNFPFHVSVLEFLTSSIFVETIFLVNTFPFIEMELFLT